MACSSSVMPRRVASSLDGWRARERPRRRAWAMVSASWRAARASVSAWSGRRRWGPVLVSSRLRCHTRCANSVSPRRGGCVDLGSEPARDPPVAAVDASVSPPCCRCGVGVVTRSGLGRGRTERLDKAGRPTSPVWPAGGRRDRRRTPRGSVRIAEGVVQRCRMPAGGCARRQLFPRRPAGEVGLDPSRSSG
jgi:hypothetical protein